METNLTYREQNLLDEIAVNMINCEPKEAARILHTALDSMKKCKKVSNPPCCYTIEEVRQRLALTDEDALNGIGIDEEEANRFIDSLI